ncbi:M14 family zinc carboxypeptidase [Pseudokineococcus lusitanus]|uniref:Zinc carboxypeptidase n=1 Tax=Pseudokineococcus lusitanus TaxID=763993 RepID=A0A3N1HTR6_9ACTN|nr:M14 family zinc carboxypeptidase [Pseudokineococcus lusitanus]ROP45796.1 zinc carboxypeptidase [Pseudokineococcus lusitanus]
MTRRTARPRRALPLLTAAVVVTTGLVAPGAAAAPAAPTAPDDHPWPSLAEVEGWPQQHRLREPADDPADVSPTYGSLPYDEIAPALNDLQRRSDRVSVEVVGRSTQGRDLYRVVVTAPETDAEARQQEEWRRQLQDDPAAAQADEELLAGYKAPVFVNGNIHGNEWEGTDAALRVVDDLATSTDPADAELLERTRVVVNVTANPDGRVAGTRANAAGYDLNRDLTIASQPETHVIRDLVVETQPVLVLDLHGYVAPTLLHPSTPPHNVNYEYDLFIKHGLPNALGIEAGLADLGYAETQSARIPFRDDEPGVWDDFPPIYVPSFSLLQSSIPYTIEAPLNPRGATLSPAERQRRADINTDVHEVAVRESLEYVLEHREEVLVDHAEVYRRGLAGEPQRELPDEYVPGWGPEDDYRTEFPRSYVIPAGPQQRSLPAAARLVDLLVDSGGRVRQADDAFVLDGTSYPAGSWVVDVHQAKRGIVNSLLEPGVDITDRVEDLYAGPAAWSQGRTWGADVVTSWDELPDVATTPVTDGTARGDRLPRGRGDLLLVARDAADLQALAALQEDGARTHLLGDGSVVVRATPAARRTALLLTRDLGVSFAAAPAGWDQDARPLDRVVVGYTGGPTVRDTLAALGLEARPLTAADAAAVLPGVDVLYVGADLDLAADGVRGAVEAFLARGGGVVGQGTAGASLVDGTDVLAVTASAGATLASGVADLETLGGPVTDDAQPEAFFARPVWFTDLGSDAVVEQRWAAEPLVAGWWPREGDGGRDLAAGQASVVTSRTAAGAGVVLLGTDPTWRLHPKGLQAQLGRALLWAATPAG